MDLGQAGRPAKQKAGGFINAGEKAGRKPGLSSRLYTKYSTFEPGKYSPAKPSK